jgi:hypothetical protein
LEDLGMDGRITRKWMLRKCGGKVWTGFNWLRIGIGGWFLRSGFIKHGEFLVSFSRRTLFHVVG